MNTIVKVMKNLKQSESDDNSGASAAPEALTETQEPMVLAQ